MKELIRKNSVIQRVSECIPARYVLSCLLFWDCFITYLMKSDMSLTIVAMVNHTAVEEILQRNWSSLTGDCPVKTISSTFEQQDGPFIWTAQDQGLILGGFFYGYIFTQLLGGWMAVKFGPKWVLGWAGLSGSILTLLTPLSASLDISVLILVRVLTGVSQGLLYPALVASISKWIPSSERGRFSMIILSGSSIGTMFSMQVGGVMTQQYGWPSVYYFFGSIGLVWFILWTFLAHNDPTRHPTISASEKKYITQNLPPYKDNYGTPWRAILTSLPTYACVIGSSAYAAANLLLLIELPSYLQNVLHIPVETNGTINAVMYVISAASSVLGGCFCDWLIKQRYLSVVATRKIVGFIGHFGSVAGIIGVSFAGCNLTLVIALFVISRTCLAIASVTDMNVVVDMAPAFAGTIFGITCTINSALGFSIPLMAGGFLKDGMGQITSWSRVFYVSCAYETLAVLVFLIFGSTDIQPWAKVEERETEKILPEKCAGGATEEDLQQSHRPFRY